MSDDVDEFSKFLESVPGDLADDGAEDAPKQSCVERLKIWDAGDDIAPPSPRRWLLGTVWCRCFVSSLVAGGGIGKTAVRLLQALSLATGHSFTGEHVFHRGRVLYLSFEDNADELRRRAWAARKHHGIPPEEVRGWLYLSTLSETGLKLATLEEGKLREGELTQIIRETIEQLGLDIIILDPFVKSHEVEENSNPQIDFVVRILTEVAIACNCAVDAPHHVSKGAAEAGNADKGRGASAFKDAARLVYTLTKMSAEEAGVFNIPEGERQLYVRMDSAKVNICRPSAEAKWFKLIGVSLDNGDDLHPHGDEVQTVEPWTPPDLWAGLSHFKLNEILTAIDAGLPDGRKYSAHSRATDTAAWRVVQEHASDKTEEAAKEMIKAWVRNKVLVPQPYHDPVARKDDVKGLVLDQARRPS
jgi:hypothetical protein